MNTQPLPELIAQSQQLLAEIRNHPQFKALRFDCDVALGDVKQYFNYLEYAATADLDIATAKMVRTSSIISNESKIRY